MNIKDYIDLYQLNKVGAHNNIEKICICGKRVSFSEKSCPNCGNKLSVSKLINVNQNSVICKRFETKNSEEIAEFFQYCLLSDGFELYERLQLIVSFNKITAEVKVSDSKYFKNLKNSEEFESFLNEIFPGFLDYANKCILQCENEYMAKSLTSLSSDKIGNIFHVYINYNAMIPYLMKYKVLNFGQFVNLKEYCEKIDFNDESQVQSLGWILPLFSVWDIRNVQHAKTIIEISKHATKSQKECIADIVSCLMTPSNDDIQWVNYDAIIKIFYLLFNKEISLENFIRIYNNSEKNTFLQIHEFQALYRKFVKNSVNWTEIKGINQKSMGILKSKKELALSGVSKTNINRIYQTLETNPMEALRKCHDFLAHSK